VRFGGKACCHNTMVSCHLFRVSYNSSPVWSSPQHHLCNFHDTCKAIVSALQKLIIKFPDGDERKDMVKGFKSTWAMIQCVGSIDGCHIPVMPPASNHTDYL